MLCTFLLLFLVGVRVQSLRHKPLSPGNGVQRQAPLVLHPQRPNANDRSRQTAKLSAVNAGSIIDIMTAKNAEMLALKEEKVTDSSKQLGRASKEIVQEKASTLGRLLEREGCISVPGVVSEATCDNLLAFINSENERLTTLVNTKTGVDQQFLFDEYFGGVNCRGTGKVATRQDMFLPLNNEVVQGGLSEAFRSLRPLLEETVTLDGMVHEISSFIGDKGAPRQCVHADTIVLPCPQYPEASMEPLYTFFVALQDIDDAMGHTVFYPRTHTPEAHTMWNAAQKKAASPQFLSGYQESTKAVQSKLRKGDVSIFDSRLLHCGMANNSEKRRVLFYFTLSKQTYWPLQGGLHGANSIRSTDRYTTRVRDFL